MKQFFAILISSLVLFGCAPTETKEAAKDTTAESTDAGVAPMGGVGAGLGGAAPVQGAENIGGGSGGGVGQAATSKARETAASASQKVATDESTTE